MKARIGAWGRIAALAIVANGSVPGGSPASEPSAWRVLADAPAFPPMLDAPAAVYDSVRRRVLAIETGSLPHGPMVVHVFEPAPNPHWSVLEAAGQPPERRYLASVVLDPVRDRMLVVVAAPGDSTGVWELTLSGTPAWMRLATTGTCPPAHAGHSTIYERSRDRIIMCGGSLTSPVDVWALSLTTLDWSALEPVGPVPGAREGHGAIYDPVHRRMIVFGGHHEVGGVRGFRNDVWELSLGDTLAWKQIFPAEPLPGPRSAFGTVYDPVRRKLLVHGGINEQSGVEPDDLWALSLDGTPAWARIDTENTLRGRSYSIDVYDPVEDRLLSCAGAGYPQASALPLSSPVRWEAVLPAEPLPSPSGRSLYAAVHDTRRDRFVIVAGGYSTADSAMWTFDASSPIPWHPVAAPRAPGVTWFEYAYAAAYDSLDDRIILFDGWQAWSTPGDGPQSWSPLGPTLSGLNANIGMRAGVTLDSHRHRLIVTGGWIPYPHGAGYTRDEVWSLSLGDEPQWRFLGAMPVSSADHAAYYDPLRDRLVLIGGYYVNDLPRTRLLYGSTAWASPVDSMLAWTEFRSTEGVLPPGPPEAWTAYDPRLDRLFIARDSTIWTRGAEDTGPWDELDLLNTPPSVHSAIAYDPVRDQLLAPFASAPGSDRVQVWALAVGPLSVEWLGADRSAEALELRWRSVTACGRAAHVERREGAGEWLRIGPIVFDARGLGVFTDRDFREARDYSYRVSIADGPSGEWSSDAVLVADATPLQFALLGARPNPARGTIRLAFSLPAAGSARMEVFDVRGRRCYARDVGDLGPGRHVIALDESEAWRPGIYFMRLQRAGETRVARVVLMY
jgi:hypothetical protein